MNTCHRPLPKHLETSERRWKTRKRREFRELLKAVSEFRMGCAYSPAYNINPQTHRVFWQELEDALTGIKHGLSIKEWGR